MLFYLYINKETTFNREGEVNKDRGGRRVVVVLKCSKQAEGKQSVSPLHTSRFVPGSV